MTSREIEEYSALRATIRARGTARVWVFVVGLAAWASLWIAEAALTLPPVASLVSLVELAAAFEGVFALHVGVERIGRYLQVFHKDAWEQAAMGFGRPLAGTGSDPLFAAFFGLAALLNSVPVIAAGAVRLELIVIGAGHAAFLARLIAARQATGRQRSADLERFLAMQQETERRPTPSPAAVPAPPVRASAIQSSE